MDCVHSMVVFHREVCAAESSKREREQHPDHPMMGRFTFGRLAGEMRRASRRTFVTL